MWEYLAGPCALAAAAGPVALLLGRPVRAIMLVVLGPVVVIGFALLFILSWGMLFHPNSYLLIAGMAVSLTWPVAILYVCVVSVALIREAIRSSPAAQALVQLAPWLEEMRRNQGSSSK